jgi:hypothetical protein
MELVEIFDAAKRRANIDSDTRLGLAIGQSHSWVYQVRSGKALPSDDAMVRLADLAGINPDIALLELQRIRARDPRIKSLWANILLRVAVCLLLGMLSPVSSARAAQFTQGANFSSQASITVYYQKRRARFRAEFRRYLDLIFPSPHPT